MDIFSKHEHERKTINRASNGLLRPHQNSLFWNAEEADDEESHLIDRPMIQDLRETNAVV